LNLSGHGVGGGAGISFVDGVAFDLLTLTDIHKQRLKSLLAPYAKIRLWSCESAKSKMQCNGLSDFAVELGVSVEAKTGDVSSGPDVTGSFRDKIGKAVAYFMKTEFNSVWREFKPHPSFSGPKQGGPPVKRVTVKEMLNGK
jgi:hypothetical protein